MGGGGGGWGREGRGMRRAQNECVAFEIQCLFFFFTTLSFRVQYFEGSHTFRRLYFLYLLYWVNSLSLFSIALAVEDQIKAFSLVNLITISYHNYIRVPTVPGTMIPGSLTCVCDLFAYIYSRGYGSHRCPS